MSTQTYAVILGQEEWNREVVTFSSIETGLSLTMSREAFDHAGRPETMTVLVPGDDLPRAAKLSYDAEALRGSVGDSE